MKGKIKRDKFDSILKKWAAEKPLFLPGESGLLEEYGDDFKYDLEKVPVWGGIKEFVFPSRNAVAGKEKFAPGPVILLGVRGCDLNALKGIFDSIMIEQEPVDTVYKSFRDRVTLISVDCNSPAETCFCVSTGGSPYGASGSDLHLSAVKDGYIAEALSEEGKRLLGGVELDEISASDERKYSDRKDAAVKMVKSNFSLDSQKDLIGEKIKNNLNKSYWDEKAKTCMQCGGCNFSCPSCYCNVLNEMSDSRKVLKALQWDSCQLSGYARVAGGATPRPHLWQGFRHRYYCKFSLMQGEFDMPGCTGCGRCIKTCPGEIDMRDTIKGLYE